jgi:hypothetical protein
LEGVCHPRILISGPVFDGIFFAYADSDKAVFAYFVSDLTRKVTSPDDTTIEERRPSSPRLAEWENSRENGIKFTLDAQDDTPPNNSKGILL